VRKSELTIDIDVNSKKFAKKLKAISNHAAALAEELEKIDASMECESCGSVEVFSRTLMADGSVRRKHYSCSECQYEWGIEYGEDEIE
jgi:transposase-like protein